MKISLKDFTRIISSMDYKLHGWVPDADKVWLNVDIEIELADPGVGRMTDVLVIKGESKNSQFAAEVYPAAEGQLPRLITSTTEEIT